MSAVDETFHPKLGKVATADLTIDGTVRKNAAALPAGNYQICSTVKAFAIQCNATVWGASLPTATQLREQGTELPAGTEVCFRVDVPPDEADTAGDGYLIFVKDAAASDGTARVVSESAIVTAVLA